MAAFTKTKTPSTSKQWIIKPSQSAPLSSSQNLIITSKQFVINSNNKRKSSIVLILFFLLLCLFLSLITLFFSSNDDTHPHIATPITNSKPLQTAAVWLSAIEKEFRGQKRIKIGFINTSNDNNDEEIEDTLDLLGLSEESKRRTETVAIHFDRIGKDTNLEWKSLFPEWIDEDEKFKTPKCPNIPMPKTELYSDLDVVVLRIPCKRGTYRDAYRLQANLAAARVAVRAGGWRRTCIVRCTLRSWEGVGR